MSSGSLWKEEEINLLLSLQEESPFDYQKIGEALDRTPYAVKYRLNKLGITRQEIYPWLSEANRKRREESEEYYKTIGIYTGFFDDFIRGAAGKKRKGAAIKEFSITLDYMLDLFHNVQKGKCYLSGIPITLPLTSKEYVDKLHTASIDRIDSLLGYTEGNVAWVHKEVNILKGSLSNERLVYWSKLIAENS